jgi:hypothetical protein
VAKSKLPRDPARQIEMAALYRGGKTLQQIGDQYGLTRERVRQIIAGLGLNREDSGRKAITAARRAVRECARIAKLDARTQNSFGCTYAQLLALNNGQGPRRGFALRFQTQRGSAATRGIEWQITFPEWMRAWSESGHLHERGRGRGYVMARKGDEGPYRPDNIYITTGAGNASDYQAKRVGLAGDTIKGYSYRPECRHRPYMVRVRGAALGKRNQFFSTPEAARAVYLANKAA